MTAFPRVQPLAVEALPEIGPLRDARFRALTLIVGAIAFLSITSLVSFTPPFSVNRAGELVPITGQTFGVLVIAATLGWRLGLPALFGYLALGAAGAPIFQSGTSGLGVLFTGATAGYLWGFVLCVLIVGWLAEHGFDRGPWLYASLILGNASIYLIGLPVLAVWLDSRSLNIPLLDAGLWPFVVGDMLKLALAAVALPVARRITRRSRD